MVARSRGKRITAVLTGLLVVGGWLGRGEVPRWTADGAQASCPAPLDSLGSFPIALARGETVTFMGDSNTSGARIGGPDAAYPALTARLMGNGFLAAVTANGGATVMSRDWPRVVRPMRGLLVVMLGSNDAAPRGLLSRRKSVPLNAYAQALDAIVVNWQAAGGQVLVLAPPPAGSDAMNHRLAPYRVAAQAVARSRGAYFRDPCEAMLHAVDPAVLQYDGLHLNANGQSTVAAWLAKALTIADERTKHQAVLSGN